MIVFLSRIRVVGHSMQPAILSGQAVLVSGIPYIFRKPKIGDIVLFKKQGEKYMIKRIVKMENSKYFITGDNSKDSLDSRKFGWVTRKDILAKVLIMV